MKSFPQAFLILLRKTDREACSLLSCGSPAKTGIRYTIVVFVWIQQTYGLLGLHMLLNCCSNCSELVMKYVFYYLYLFSGFPIAITVAIAVFLSITIFAIFPVFPITVVISVFTLIHVNAVNQCTEVREFVAFL